MWDAMPGDSLFLLYSGHGSQIQDETGDEADHMDEIIIPVDYNTGGIIKDDELKTLLSQHLPEGARYMQLYPS